MMYEVLMYDGGVYQVNELYELVEDIGGFVIQKTQIQVQIMVTMAIPEEERPTIEAKTRELGGKIVDVPLGRHGDRGGGPDPREGTTCPIPPATSPSNLRRLRGHHRGHGLGPGKGTADRADQCRREGHHRGVRCGGVRPRQLQGLHPGAQSAGCSRTSRYRWSAVCGPQIDSLPNCEALVCGIGRKVERMRREEEIARLDEVSEAIEKVIKAKRKDHRGGPAVRPSGRGQGPHRRAGSGPA